MRNWNDPTSQHRRLPSAAAPKDRASGASPDPAAGMIMVDGDEAVAHVVYRLNEVLAIYPIPPISAPNQKRVRISAEDAVIAPAFCLWMLEGVILKAC